MAAILYVQVEGEDSIAQEDLVEGDSVQSVVKRASKDGDINKILWKDVAGWKLLDSRDEEAKELTSGKSSERLAKLPPFPDDSLLILTRRPKPPINSTLGEIKMQSRQITSQH